jgi:hypothetical protein
LINYTNQSGLLALAHFSVRGLHKHYSGLERAGFILFAYVGAVLEHVFARPDDFAHYSCPNRLNLNDDVIPSLAQQQAL